MTRTDDPNPASSSCTPTDCTLRAAISAANLTPGAILIPPGTYTIALGSSGEDANAGGDFDIRAGMSIYGAGVGQTIIDANHLDRIFDIDPDSFSNPATGRVTALIADLSLVNGGGPSFYGDGGAIRAYSSSSGSPVNNDFVVLDHVQISNSRSQLNGGAVAMSARGQFIGCEFTNNYAARTGGGLTLGASFAAGDTIIELIDSTVAQNQSPSGYSGGGGIKSTANLRVTNSTIANNTTGYHGGGIYATATGVVTIRSSTIAGNAAASGGGSGNGGGIRMDNGSINLANVILSGNTHGSGTGTPDDCTAGGGSAQANYSLYSAASGCNFSGANNLVGIDPGFNGGLANHGGPTRILVHSRSVPQAQRWMPGTQRAAFRRAVSLWPSISVVPAIHGTRTDAATSARSNSTPKIASLPMASRLRHESGAVWGDGGREDRIRGAGYRHPRTEGHRHRTGGFVTGAG